MKKNSIKFVLLAFIVLTIQSPISAGTKLILERDCWVFASSCMATIERDLGDIPNADAYNTLFYKIKDACDRSN
jgi:hypothetical protein